MPCKINVTFFSVCQFNCAKGTRLLFSIILYNIIGITTQARVPTSQQFVLVGASPAKPINSNKLNLASEDEKKDDINSMPATVEDHFAKALGDQWSQLNSGNNVSPSSNTVKS